MSTTQIKNIIEGFEDDFRDIAGDFPKKHPELRLVNFFEYWNEISLDCLFANRFDPRELLEAIQEIYKHLVRILTDTVDQDFSRKLVALYLMFCIAAKQPERLRRKVRLTCEDGILLQNIFSHPRSSETEYLEDAKLVWELLRKKSMVEFVEERCIYGPSLLLSGSAKKGEVDPEEEELLEDDRASLNFVENKINPILRDIDSVCAPYEQIKSLLKLDDYNDPTVEVKSLGSIRDLVNEAKSLLSEFRTDNY